MRKLVTLVFVIGVIAVMLIGCSKARATTDIVTSESSSSKVISDTEIIEVVYNQLSQEDKDSLDYDLNNIKVLKKTLTKGVSTVTDKSYLGKEVYFIDFKKSDNKIVPDNFIAIATVEDYTLIGYGLVD